MKKSLLMSLLTTTILVSQVSFANGLSDKKHAGYIGMHVGGIDTEGPGSQLFDLGYELGGQVGYQLNNIRFEEELTYTENRLKNQDNIAINYFSAMTNILFGLNVSSEVALYVGAGVGYMKSWLDSSIPNARLSINLTDGFAYQGIAGLSFMYEKDWNIDIAYHYVACHDCQKLYAHVLDVRFNYLFGQS